MSERPRTDFLFVEGSALIGAGWIFDLAGSYFLFNTSESGAAADERALGADWRMVGQDIRDALDIEASET